MPLAVGLFDINGSVGGFNFSVEIDQGTFVTTYYGADVTSPSRRRLVSLTGGSTNQVAITNSTNKALVSGTYNKAA